MVRGLCGTSILTGVRKRSSVDRMEMGVVIVGTFSGMDKSSRGGIENILANFAVSLERRSSWNCLRNWAMLAGPVRIGRRLFMIGIVVWLGSSDIVILEICE